MFDISVITVNVEVGHQLMDKRVLTQHIDRIQPHILHNLPKPVLLAIDDSLSAPISFTYTIFFILT